MGLRACEKISKPCLSQKNVQERFRFAMIHKDWTVEDWKRVMFSDETKINRFNADGRSWCWVNDKENVPNRAVKQTAKHGGGSVMLWSCMTVRGLGDLQRVEGRMNAKDYIAVLHGDLYLSLERLGYFNYGSMWRSVSVPLLHMSVKDCMLVCPIKLQQFWLLMASGQNFRLLFTYGLNK